MFSLRAVLSFGRSDPEHMRTTLMIKLLGDRISGRVTLTRALGSHGPEKGCKAEKTKILYLSVDLQSDSRRSAEAQKARPELRVIPTRLPNRCKAGNCRIRLALQDGTIIGPSDFSP